jgi:DNA gyrase subunit A
MEILEKGSTDTMLMVTQSGYGKRTELDEYRIQSRGGVGIITQKTTDRVGLVVGVRKVTATQEVILSTDKGQVIRMKVSDISVLGRNTQGVRLINISEKEEVVKSLAVVDEENIAAPGAASASTGVEAEGVTADEVKPGVPDEDVH